ncbi:Aste57867_12125 [Aphanomyces stellatus]|uniref:Aste57867_12125 protein n=1 Tax=Aphanomyces stellatus TaxID=120398 RepID=A0A485KV65_9STRA|nr:hypothetical protein As57867_012080 [Aphanomyces stellatus]VFT88979.1 Aste57867_12125 [Aphanomyces stellatus]
MQPMPSLANDVEPIQEPWESDDDLALLAKRCPVQSSIVSKTKPKQHLTKPAMLLNVPPKWELPSLTCRQLWTCWYFGDGQVGSYRHLCHLHSNSAKLSTRRLTCARIVMSTCVAIATAHAFVTPHDDLLTMDLETSLAVFERAFQVFMFNNPDGNLAGIGVGQIRPENTESCCYSTVARALSPSARTKRRLADVDDSDDEGSF